MHMTVRQLLESPELQREVFEFMDYVLGNPVECLTMLPNGCWYAHTKMVVSGTYGWSWADDYGTGAYFPDSIQITNPEGHVWQACLLVRENAYAPREHDREWWKSHSLRELELSYEHKDE